MATHDYVLANASGAAFRADLNNALAAIVSNNSSTTEPATTYAYMWWADTTSGQLKLRNAANDDWVVIQELDGTLLMEDGTVGAPGLAFASDLDTGLLRPAANQLAIATNGVERIEFGTSEVVVNDGGADVDFRVEGDTEANLLVVDAGNDRIGIAESAPGTLVEIGSETPYVTLKNSTEEDTDGGRESKIIFEGEQSGGEISSLAEIEVSHEGTSDDEKGQVILKVNSGAEGSSPTERMRIDSTGQVIINAIPTSSSAGATIESGGSAFFAKSGGSGPLQLARTTSNGTQITFYNQGSTAGSITTNSTTTTQYNTSSDYRLKENVVPLTGAVNRLNQLPVHRFNFIADPDTTVDGFLAHEAQTVVPESVTGIKDEIDDEGNPIYQGIDQSKLVPLLTAALQEAIERIETLETEVAALKNN